MTATRKKRKWSIGAFAAKVDYGEVRDAEHGGIQSVEIVFECPSPFWLSDAETVVKFSYVEGGMSFPLSFPSYFGTLGYLSVIRNNGNAYVPVRVTISGGGTNPTLTNRTTGGKIQVNRSFGEGDRLFVDTDPDGISVRIETRNTETGEWTGENAFGWLSGDSELFTLAPGDNVISFKTDDENKTLRVTLSYRDRFVGV